MAIPVRGEDGKITHSELFKFVAPVVEDPTGQGKGEDLPIILGLRSQSSKKGVLEMDPGKQALTFPGPGGYEIDWKPGATRIAVEKALSSHLMVPIGAWDMLKSVSFSDEPDNTFHATDVTEGGASSSSFKDAVLLPLEDLIPEEKTTTKRVRIASTYAGEDSSADSPVYQ